ncbi:MAG: hypothetical protein WBL44_10625 [Nitrososphaeraceae archaeon]
MPGKFQSMYYNMSSETLRLLLLLQTSISQNEFSTSQYGYNEATLEKILLDEAEQIYSKLIDNISNRCINEITNDAKSFSQILHLCDMQDGLSTDEVYHSNLNTIESEVSNSAIMSRFATEICNSLNLIDKQSRGTEICREKDEIDIYNFQLES